MAVFVLGKQKEPLMPCSEKRGRLLLKRGRARVHKMYPFTIRLVDRESGETQPLALKIDPGSKQTGIAIVHETCVPCNEFKDDRLVEEFLATNPERLAKIRKQLQLPLKDAAAVNATRWALYRALAETGLPVSTGSGGRTKFNRHRFSITKAHALDAVCAGNMDHITEVCGWQQPTLSISANGRGSYKRTRLTAHGFPRGYLMRSKSVHGFTTGDMVRAEVPAGKKQGSYIARIAVRASGSFNLQTASGVIQGISHKHCRLLQRGDGYGYQLQKLSKGTIGKAGRAGGLSPASLSLPGPNAGVSRIIL